MALNDVFHKKVSDVDPGEDVIIDGTSAETGAAEVFEFGGDPDVEIYRESEADVEVLIDAFEGPYHSQKNQLVVSQSNDHRIRIRVVAGNDEPGDVYVTGMEVND